MKDNGKLIIALLGFWVILAEKLSLEVLLVGIIICIGITYVSKDNQDEHAPSRKCNTFKKSYYIVLYALILIKEIVIANIQVAMIVLSKNMDISPSTFVYETKLSSDKYRTFFANSITLTPGTISVSMNDRKIVVHCLKNDYINSVMNSKLEKILLEIEG